MSNSSVKLHVYDLSGGLCSALSTQLLGRHFEAIYHTGVVAFGREWFFGGGIFNDAPGQTHYGTPLRVVDLGVTALDEATFIEFLDGIRPRFRMQDYDLVRHNCNNFSEEIVQFLTGRSIGDDILTLPQQLIATPLGASLRPMLEAQQQRMTEFYTSHGGQANPLQSLVATPPPPSSTTTSSSIVATPPFVLFTAQKSTDRVVAKLREFAAVHVDSFSPQEKAALAALVPERLLASVSVVPLVSLTRKLPLAKRFPALDLLRVVLADAAAVRALRAVPDAERDLVAVLAEPVEADAAATRMALRCVANLFASVEGRALALALSGAGAGESDGGVALSATCRALEHLGDEQTAIGAASCAFNLTHLFTPDSANADIAAVPSDVRLSEDAQTQLAALASALSSTSGQNKAAPILLSALLQIVQHNAVHREVVRQLELDLSPFASFPEHATLTKLLAPVN
jgi:hypothetical protein